jgi:hypothetical protein
MGRSAGEFLVGTDFLFPDVLTLRGQAEGLLRECAAPLVLDPADFVFAMHQGYQFLFFRCDGSDDPPVFHYQDGDSFTRVADRFSAWLAYCVVDESEATGSKR